MKLIAVSALLTLSATPAAADAVQNAFAVCQTIDATGLASKPCEVSGWNSAVIATLDMNSGEARDLCSKLSNHLKGKNMLFGPGWTLQIRSPYSGDNSIAFCNLPR